MFEAIILGVGAGLISSFLTGPVFFAMIKTSIEKGFKAGLSLASGVILSDIVLISVILFGTQFFEYKESFDKYVGLVGGIFIVCVGFYYLFSTVKINYNEADNLKVSKRNYVLKGFLMCLLTPSTLMFWVTVSAIISVKLSAVPEKILCFLIAMTTQLGVDAVKTFYASKFRYKIKETTLRKVNKAAGLIIIGFAVWLIIKTYLKFYT